MTDADIAEDQMRNRDPVRPDLEYGFPVAGVQDGPLFAADGDGPVRHQAGLVVKALREDEGVARAGGRQGAGQCGVRVTRPDVEARGVRGRRQEERQGKEEYTHGDLIVSSVPAMS